MTKMIVVGAGPIGLWTALQIKDQNPEAEITVIDKYADAYKRDYHLRINPKSLPKADVNSRIHEVAEYLRTAKNPRTKEIEQRLATKAMKENITIIRGQAFTTKEELIARFPEADIFIGADGARSLFREKIFGDKDIDQDLHYIAEAKYDVKGDPSTEHAIRNKVLLNFKTATFNKCYLGKYDEVNDVTPVTLRTFISKKSFENIEDWSSKKDAKLKNLEELKARDIEVSNHFQSWIKENDELSLIVPGSDKISVTKLNCYRSKNFVKIENTPEKKRAFFLVGDAAFGVPFFRSMNNGLLAGTKLAECIARYSRENSSTSALYRSFFKKNPVKDYENYMKKSSRSEILSARIKSLGIKSYIWGIGSKWSIIRIIVDIFASIININPSAYIDETFKKT